MLARRTLGVAMLIGTLLSAGPKATVGFVPADGSYPLTLTLDGTAGSANAAVTAAVSVRVDRLMEENRRKRVIDALTYSGYGNFLNALRALPAIGEISLPTRSVEIRYAVERADEVGRRLVLVADRPLFFLGDPNKARAGYELTIVVLRFTPDGHVSGTMSGAARVKPIPDGIALDDYAEAPVRLDARAAQPRAH